MQKKKKIRIFFRVWRFFSPSASHFRVCCVRVGKGFETTWHASTWHAGDNGIIASFPPALPCPCITKIFRGFEHSKAKGNSTLLPLPFFQLFSSSSPLYTINAHTHTHIYMDICDCSTLVHAIETQSTLYSFESLSKTTEGYPH